MHSLLYTLPVCNWDLGRRDQLGLRVLGLGVRGGTSCALLQSVVLPAVHAHSLEFAGINWGWGLKPEA